MVQVKLKLQLIFIITYFLFDQVEAPCTSLAMSPTGEFLATSHVDYKGIFLWSNRTLFSLVSLKPLSADSVAPLVSLPSTASTQREVVVEDTDSDKETEEDELGQIEELVTLSTLASSRWQNLLDIELVKKRNKPIEPPKVPKAAPFFLPTLPSLNLEFDLSSVLGGENGSKTIQLQNVKRLLSPFAKLLMDSEDFQVVVDKLKSLGPSAIDFEVNSLAIEGQDCEAVLLKFMEMLNHLLRTNKDFELGQAYLALFLKVHGEIVATTPTLHDYMEVLQEAQASGWKTLQERIWYTLAAVNLLKES